MPLVSLRDLYILELHDLVDAERSALAELPALAAAATSTPLRELFQEHIEQTRIHAERLELTLRRLGAAVSGAPCEAMRGLISDTKRRMEDGEKGDVLDAALIAAAQRIEHFEIAACGCALTYARTLGDADAEALLQQTLEEESDVDARLTGIAVRDVNESASEGVVHDEEAKRSRLRYVPARRIRGFAYGEFPVRDVANNDLGRVDGVVLDARSGRPEYFVIDARGWFAGKRFLVPVDALRPDAAARTLRTDLERQTIEAYPPFNPDAFASADHDMRDDTDGSSRDTAPTWLMTGVWMTEASGFAAVPPRAQSDLAPPPEHAADDERRR